MYKHAVGDWIYVWTNNKEKAKTQGCDKVLLLAHGGEGVITGLIGSRKPADIGSGVKLYFFTEHGFSLKSKAGMEEIDKVRKSCVTTITSKYPKEEEFTTDYILEKCVGRHAVSTETKRLVDSGVTYKDLSELDATWTVGALDRLREGIEDDGEISRAVDIITIRNRRCRIFEPYLSAVIKQVRADGFDYQHFYCHICRGVTPLRE